MGTNVFANNHEISSKASGHKVVAEFPDVCMSPPSPPAGPIPIPYPDTSFSKDMKNGTKSVKIINKEVMQKDKSFYKTSPLGDEAATRSFGANIITHVITGKTYFVAWSMDVIFEGKNVCRNIDLTTSNHASKPGGTGPFSVSLAEAVSFLGAKAVAKWGHKRGKKRHNCGNNHEWQCDVAQCPDCWQPPCEPNAKEEQEKYKKTQKGTAADKAAMFKEANNEKIASAAAKGNDDLGAKLENEAVDRIGVKNIERAGFKAHCKKCHMVQEIDFVTKDSIVEAKNSTGLLKLKQMQRIAAVRDQCFPGKDLKTITQQSETSEMIQKLSEKEWQHLSVSVIP